MLQFCSGLQHAPGRIRIPSLLIRSQVLYPVELRARGAETYHRPRVAAASFYAQERTRTSTTLRPLAPQASASTNSATWA